jgi:hypothetical protein
LVGENSCMVAGKRAGKIIFSCSFKNKKNILYKFKI